MKNGKVETAEEAKKRLLDEKLQQKDEYKARISMEMTKNTRAEEEKHFASRLAQIDPLELVQTAWRSASREKRAVISVWVKDQSNKVCKQ